MIREAVSSRASISEPLSEKEWLNRLESKGLPMENIVRQALLSRNKVITHEVEVVILTSDKPVKMRQFLKEARRRSLSLPALAIAFRFFGLLLPETARKWGLKRIIFPHSPPYAIVNHSGDDFLLCINCDDDKCELGLAEYFPNERYGNLYGPDDGMVFIRPVKIASLNLWE